MDAFDKLARALGVVRRTRALLECAARDYAGGLIDFTTLEAVAKKHTNARHEQGRAEKHAREAEEKAKLEFGSTAQRVTP